jgi:hypothetical protein
VQPAVGVDGIPRIGLILEVSLEDDGAPHTDLQAVGRKEGSGEKENESWEEGKKGGEREGGRLAGREQHEQQQ